MAGITRNRNRVADPEVGFWDHGSGGVVHYSERRPDDTCVDVVGNRLGENPFAVTKREMEGCRVRSLTSNLADFPLSWSSTGSGPQYVGAPADSTYVSRILSQSGPLTPNIYLPVSVFELRDIPRMLRHAGDLLHKIRLDRIFRHGIDPAKEAASSVLAYQFGWAPLIEDIGKMVRFAELAKKRQQILQGAHSSKGIRRRVTLLKDTQTVSGTQGVHSAWSVGLNSKYTAVRSIDRWSTIRWTVRDPTQVGYVPTFSEAFNVALGLNKGYIPISVWKAMPWSWAIDWFADISNKMQASHNMVYYKPSRLNIMTTYVTERTFAESSNNARTYAFTGGKCKTTLKTRSQHSPNNSLSLRLPFMDSFKLSILGSMTILRLSR